jgi:prepilin-type N-terminal cleavage/methylation domain-containing protein
MHPSSRSAFTLIELLVVIAIIAILAVVVVLTLNPAQLLAQSRDANRLSDMATLSSALNLYTTDQAGANTFSLGNASNTAISVYDPTASSTCGSLGLLSLNTSTGQAWQCSSSSTYRNIISSGWIPVNLQNISAGSPIGNLPVDPVNQTSSDLFYAYNTNGSQFEVTADLESQKYKAQYGNSAQTNLFPEIISGGTQGISALYNPIGLVGYWPMNEGNGSSTIDASGNGNVGTWSGSASGTNSTYYSPGKVGLYAGYFNGQASSTSGTQLTATMSGTLSTFTLNEWINMSSWNTAGANVMSDAQFGGTGFYPAEAGTYRVTSGPFSSSASLGEFGTTSPAVDQLGSWYMFTWVEDANNVYIYVNGSFSASSTRGTPSGSATNPGVQVGNTYPACGGGCRDLIGSTDDLRIYNRTLSPAEVMALYNSQK